jgi:hypothetical protein
MQVKCSLTFIQTHYQGVLFMTILASENGSIIGIINPADRVGTTANGTAIDLAKFHQAMFLLLVGNTDATVDFKLQESASTSSGFTDISGKAVTTFAATDDNKQAIINLDSSEMGSSKRYVRGVITAGSGTACVVGMVALGFSPRFRPATDDDLASVSQVVS